MKSKECTREYTRITPHAIEGDMELLKNLEKADTSIEECLSMEIISYWNNYSKKEYPFEFVVVVLLCVDKENCCHKVQRLIPASDFFITSLKDFVDVVAKPNSRDLCLTMGNLVEPKDIIQYTTVISPNYVSDADYIEEKNPQPVQMINPGPDKQKAIIVTTDAIKGFERQWSDYAFKNDLKILPINGKDLKSEWDYVVKMVHHAFEYGLHCNDMTFSEIEDDIAFALDKFAKAAGFPAHDWEADYNELYPVEDEDA